MDAAVAIRIDGIGTTWTGLLPPPTGGEGRSSTDVCFWNDENAELVRRLGFGGSGAVVVDMFGREILVATGMAAAASGQLD